MEAAIRSPQVGTSQQSAQQPQSELSGARGTTAGPPPHPLHSMSYSQPRTSVSGGINEVHRSSATNSSPYQISPHNLPPHSYVDRNRVRPANSFTGASMPGKNYNWQPQTTQHYDYGVRTTIHQPTIVSAPSFVNASFTGFPPRVSIPNQPPTQQQPNVSQAPRPITVNEYITTSIRDAAASAHLQASQPNQRPQTQPQPDPGGNSSAPAYKKIRLEPPYQSQQANSIGHPGSATAPTTIPVRLHHANYDKAGPIQPNNQVVVHVASTPRSHQNPVVGATAELQYQPQKPPQQQPTHQISTAASPQQQQAAATQQAQQNQQSQNSSNNPSASKALSVLKIDTRDPPSANNNNASGTNAGGYHPKTEAISPAGSPKLSKDDLLQQISSVDSSMMSLEERKRILKEKERLLIEQKEEGVSPDVPEVPTPHRTLAQQIYAENKKKANDSHAILNALNYKGQIYELPLYNQPSDADVCRKIHEHYLTFRSTLLLHLRKIKSERAQRNQELSEKYAKLSADWQKRVEKIESSIKRKNREVKNRELFEKVFVELRKQREDKERFNRVGSRVKSEADFEVIVDGLQEQAQEDKKMRSYAVIPPIMFDNRQRRLVFHNENGSNVDMEAELSAYKTFNLWTSGEKEIFRDKYIQQAKNFGFIADHLERKQPQDCVLYYYLSKKDVKYKQLLRKSSKRTRSTKNLPKTSESQSLLDLMTTGVTTRLQRKAKTGGRSTTSTSAAASVSESQTITRSSAPLPTVTVTVGSNPQNQEMAKEETDPLCIRSMSENASSSPAPTSITRRASSNGNQQNVETSFLSTKIKTDPDGDVVMKTESDSNSNSWPPPTYPPNGLKHEAIKAEDIKVEIGKSSDDATIKKEESNQKDEKKVEIKKEPDEKESNADEAKGKKVNAHMDVDDENWSSYEPSSAKKRKIDESGANDMDKNLYPCYVCKQENCSRTRPLEKGKTQQYGIGNEENIPQNARICNNCQSKAAKSRYSTSSCPLPTCQNSKDRLKRVRNIPAELFEMQPEQRDPIIKELQIPPNVTKCCSACLTRIKRQMGTRLSLSDDEIQQFRKQLQEVGPKWSQLAEQLNKSATVLKTFYFHNKKKYGFDQAVNEFYKTHANEGPRPITDGDESDVSVTSSDDNGSDTLKGENDGDKDMKNEPILVTTSVTATPVTSISNVPMQIPTNKEIISIKSDLQIPQMIDDRLPPPLGQPPPLLSSQQIQNLSVTGLSRGPDTHPLVSVMMRTKKHSEEYDSSATETADEENESSPANRQSPKTSSVFSGKNLNPATTISMVSSMPQNGPLSSVQDVVLNVIERSLKIPSGPSKQAVPPLKPNPPQAPLIDNNPEVTFVGTYRHDPNKLQIQPQRRGNSDGLQTLATLSIVNSHGGPNSGPNSQMLGGHPLNISSIAATITPVPPSQMNQPRSSLPPQHLTQAQEKDLKFGIRPGLNQQQPSEPEPQTLDLSIKKPAQQQQQQPERNFPAFQAKAPPPPTGGSIYRGDPNIPSQSNYLAFHPDVNRPSKSPSTHIPPPLSPNQRVLSLPPHAIQQSSQGIQNKSKIGAQKLSPKVHHQTPVSQSPGSQQVQQMNGPKGSITLGTPLNDRGQPIMIPGGPPGGRYDILRQTPPSADNKFGSITAGTPIHLSDKRVHEYMKNRHSPATSQPNVSQAPVSGSPHHSMAPTYRGPNELSSTRDLIFSDYLISQQMQGQSRVGPNIPNTINIISSGPGNMPQGRPEKESPSPRNIAHPNSPAAMYYAEKERERAGGQTRAEYLSRSSPADHHNSTPSPHRTPPPQQRQGVIIQRHNASSSKPPSPAPSRLPPQGQFPSHHYSHGHDALSHLVDVAVAQQALPVPNDNNRRPSHIPVTSSESQSLPPPRDRFGPYHLLPADVVALQHQQAQMELIRRQQEFERKEREMHHERERDRERDERESQRRNDAELAQRNYEREQRDRIEQLRIAGYAPRIPYPGRSESDAQMISAQCLINAIITENIRPSEPRERYPPMNREQLARLQQQSENNGNSHSPNIINVDVDSSSDLPRHPSMSGQMPKGSIKLGDITEAIIAKDPSFNMHHQQQGGYHISPGHFIRAAGAIPSKTPPNQNPSIPMGQDQIIATDQWKLNRRMQQQQQQKEEMAKSGNPQGRSTPDDRHIIRMQQSPSPRNKMPPYEPVSPPDAGVHYHPKIQISYDQRKGMQIAQEQQPGADGNKLLNMLNHRIAEVMRNDDKYPNDHDGKERRESDQMKGYERPRSGPGNGVDGDKSPVGKRESPHVYISRPSSQPGNQPYPPPSSIPYMYAYNPLTMPQVSTAGPIISPKPASEMLESNRQQQNLETTRQVMSDNYDALSDDDN